MAIFLQVTMLNIMSATVAAATLVPAASHVSISVADCSLAAIRNSQPERGKFSGGIHVCDEDVSLALHTLNSDVLQGLRASPETPRRRQRLQPARLS